jgi:hypothetical protein
MRSDSGGFGVDSSTFVRVLSCLASFTGEACWSSARPFLRINKRKKMFAYFFW